ncbi:Nucleotide-binding universal stress protein, UspA family [Thermomonospora echinospora]|uniref:Nucleotide-binding universal stress protein, UspA family n=1 Tax=Thermomonospora echinospora TaxID=1992 RepID=A0A1H5VL75_9ACTN|nr:universal stress protein [Thermomonospora echinospora]SEF88014.1 Nucleotide-binding universal stress protein, UspA family [Thermomonospora echinospora]
MNAGRIVVGVDGSQQSREALRWAARQARLTGARLELITAWDMPVTFGAPVYEGDYDLSAVAGQTLTETTAEVLGPEPDVPITPTVVRGHPAQVLVEASKGAELLVMGSRGHGGIVGVLLGSTSRYCVQRAKCPVVVLPGVEAEAEE